MLYCVQRIVRHLLPEYRSSLSGMLIQADQPLESESRLPMGLSLGDDKRVELIGRVVTCKKKEESGRAYYEIGVEFIDVAEKDTMLLKTCTDSLAAMEACVKEGT